MKKSKVIKKLRKYNINFNIEKCDDDKDLIFIDTNNNSFVYDKNEESLYIHYSNGNIIFSKRLKLHDLEMILILNIS